MLYFLTMKLICVDDDHPGLKKILKACGEAGESVGIEDVKSVEEAVGLFLAEGEDVAVFSFEEDPPRVNARTFGNFDLKKDGKTVYFHRSRAKEVLAYLIDRQGAGVSRGEIFAALYEDDIYDRARQKQFDVILRSLKDTLSEYEIEDILEADHGMIRVIPEKIDCDLYRFFDGDEKTISSYMGEYMSSYSWAMMTEAYLDQKVVLDR